MARCKVTALAVGLSLFAAACSGKEPYDDWVIEFESCASRQEDCELALTLVEQAEPFDQIDVTNLNTGGLQGDTSVDPPGVAEIAARSSELCQGECAFMVWWVGPQPAEYLPGRDDDKTDVYGSTTQHLAQFDSNARVLSVWSEAAVARTIWFQRPFENPQGPIIEPWIGSPIIIRPDRS